MGKPRKLQQQEQQQRQRKRRSFLRRVKKSQQQSNLRATYANSAINSARNSEIKAIWTFIFGENVRCCSLALIVLRLSKYRCIISIFSRNALILKNSSSVKDVKNRFSIRSLMRIQRVLVVHLRSR